jgi:hypothetical protein
MYLSPQGRFSEQREKNRKARTKGDAFIAALNEYSRIGDKKQDVLQSHFNALAKSLSGK